MVQSVEESALLAITAVALAIWVALAAPLIIKVARLAVLVLTCYDCSLSVP